MIHTLLAWYRIYKRNLPWRHTKNAYHIFISELMLQQTQVDRVLPKYRAWLRRFPSWTRLANAKTNELIHQWAGLGYNRRALFAREAARDIVKRGIPQNANEWRQLKGVGAYMAAALVACVNHARAIVIDTNIRRVAGRALLGLPYPYLTDDSKIYKALDRVVPMRSSHWLIPQAFMDLGSAICLPTIPRCDICPLQSTCRARHQFLAKRKEATLRLLREQRKKTHVNEMRHPNKKHPDRIYRGRMLAWIRMHGPTRIALLGARIDETYVARADLTWIRNIVARLIQDGLIIRGRNDTIALPRT